MKRTIRRRTIYPPGIDIDLAVHSLDLGLVAHAAAVETLQVDLVAKGWVGLFDALLTAGADTSPLEWAGTGPGGEAEIKRAYSALFGRFFGRAILRNEHHCLALRQVRDGLSLAAGLTLERKVPGSRGDLPDWVGWSSYHGCYSICEAKGSYERAPWSGRTPPILGKASDQLDRVQVVDAAGHRLQTKDWVVASRWGTAANGRETTIITKDPLTEGRELSPEEALRSGRDAYALWLADLLAGMGRGRTADMIRNEGDWGKTHVDEIARLYGSEAFVALVVDGFGVLPLRGDGRRARLELARDLAADSGSKIAIIAIDAAAVRNATERSWMPDGDAVVDDDGRYVNLDGVTLSWDIQAVEF